MSELQHRPVGATRLNVTAIGLGALEIGRDWGIGDDAARKRPDDIGAAGVLNEALGLGINLIDTASAYHRSEERIGRFASDRRKKYVLASKCGEHSDEPRTYYDFSYKAIRDSIRRSRELLHTDVIDIMQIHFGPEPAKVLDDGECVRAMKDAREAAEIRFLGASIGGEMLDRCIDSGDFQVVQVAYSLLDTRDGTRIARARERGIGVFIRGGLGGGWLTPRILTAAPDKRPPKAQALLDLCRGDAHLLYAMALHFLLMHDGISSILVGTKRPENLREAVNLASRPFDPEPLARAAQIAAA